MEHNYELYKNIPRELKERPQWVCYNDKKIPINPNNGEKARCNNKATWSTYEVASKAAESNNMGVGFQFTTEDPYIFIDFDNKDNKLPAEKKEEIIKHIKALNTYTEISPSGFGFHCIIKNADVSKIKRMKSINGIYEIYHHGRYATFTGRTKKNNLLAINESPYFEEFYSNIMKDVIIKESKNFYPQWLKQEDRNMTDSDIDSMLSIISPSCSYDQWLNIGMALHSYNVPSSVYESWSSGGSTYKAGEATKKYKSFKRNEIKIGTLIKYALDEGWKFPEKELTIEDYSDVDLSFLDYLKTTNKKFIDIDDIKAIVKKSVLYPFIKELEQVMVPSLPLQLTLSKALTLVGTSLCGKTTNGIISATGRGVVSAKVRIGGSMLGIPPYFYCINVAESGVGKDIGGILSSLSYKNNLNVGAGLGSAEGLQDTLTNKDAAILSISEMKNFFDPKAWEHKSSGFLTALYSDLCFDIPLSKRSKNTEDRKNDYCCLSILGSIQPEILKDLAGKDLLDSGFLGRCMFFVTPKYEADKCIPNEEMEDNTDKLDYIMKELFKIEGHYQYNQKFVKDKVVEYANKKMDHSTLWKRLFNENVKKIAFILSIDPNTFTIDKITDKAVKDALIICEWIYNESTYFFDFAQTDDIEKKFNKMSDRVFDFINKEDRTQSQVTARFQAYRKLYDFNGIMQNLIMEKRIFIETITTKTKPQTVFTTNF